MQIRKFLFFIVFTFCCLARSKAIEPLLLVHGGAGDVKDDGIQSAKDGVKHAARTGYEVLKSTGSVLDAVEAAVKTMELNPRFNAGYGSVLTWDATVEMDAAIMSGFDLSCGSVSQARDIYHPSSLARTVMEKTRHRYMAGEGAMKIAIENGFEILPANALVTEASLKALEDYKNSLNSSTFASEQKQFGSPGTVGAVAIDAYGNVAAVTTTGGLTGKLSGRIGDSPIIGGGTYADNDNGAVSATGHGEQIMRYRVASRILSLIEFEHLTAQEATSKVLDALKERFNATAGVISLDPSGNVGVYFTTNRMSWAYQRGQELHFGVDKGEDEVEMLGDAHYDFL